MAFSFPLFTVTIATILAYVPHFIRVILARKSNAYDNRDPRNTDIFADLSPESADLQRRLIGAHTNQLELLGPYAAAVVANIVRKEQNWVINLLTALYISFRVFYIIAYASPPILGGYLRTVVFAGCLATTFALWTRAFT